MELDDPNYDTDSFSLDNMMFVINGDGPINHQYWHIEMVASDIIMYINWQTAG